MEQPIFISSATKLSDTPPENKQDWLHPVITEPQNKIKLTHSTYQVTPFLDSAPFVNGFNNVKNYIKNFKEVNYLENLFDVVYQKFLNAIDHTEYHPTLQNEPAVNRSNVLFSFLKLVSMTLLITD